MPGGGCALPGLRSGSDCLLARQATAPPGDGIRHGAAFIPGGGYAYPAYNPKSPLAQGLLKLPVLAASTSLRRSRKAGAAAWMRAEGRVLQGRCLGPTRSLQG